MRQEQQLGPFGVYADVERSGFHRAQSRKLVCLGCDPSKEDLRQGRRHEHLD